jgi:hypothetical protein
VKWGKIPPLGSPTSVPLSSSASTSVSASVSEAAEEAVVGSTTTPTPIAYDLEPLKVCVSGAMAAGVAMAWEPANTLPSGWMQVNQSRNKRRSRGEGQGLWDNG